jgi:cobalt/nickel transport system permease protein
LLIRSVERAERIYRAMLSRGFRGEIRVLRRLHLRYFDIVFATGSITMFYILRNYDVVDLIGATLDRLLR